MPTITGWIAVADVSDGQTFTRYYSTASVGGSISTTQGSRKYFYDVIHNVSASPVAPTALTVFNLLIGSDGADGSDGSDGADGSDAVRYAEVTLYTNPTVANAPSAPSATITWSTSAISSITSGWSQTPPTISANSTNSVYSSQLIFIDATAPFTTTTVTGTTPIQSINFTGVVTFNSGDFLIGGSTITTIDGSNLTTGTVNAEKIDVDSAITLTGATSSFIAGRTGASDFGTDGFFIGRTSTGGNAADGFQLSHTSVTEAGHPQLNSGTVQGVIHDDTQGLRIYEPVFYKRGTVTGADSLLDAAGETATLAAGEVHSVTLWGGGGGGGGGADSSGNAANSGNAGGTSTVVLTGATGYNGTRTFNAVGGSSGTGGSGQGTGSGGDGGPTAFGAGGTGGGAVSATAGNNPTSTQGLPGSAPATGVYGAGGGGGSGGAHRNGLPATGNPGVGGGGSNPNTITFDLTNSNTDGTLTLNVLGAAGNAGNNNNNNSDDNTRGGVGGAGRSGVASVSGVLDGYTTSTLSDLTPPGSLAFPDNGTGWTTSNNFGSISAGTNGIFYYTQANARGGNSSANRGSVGLLSNSAGSWAIMNLNNYLKINGEVYSINGGNGNNANTTGSEYGYVAPGGNLVRSLNQSTANISTRYRSI
jgi:hypothetical protein